MTLPDRSPSQAGLPQSTSSSARWDGWLCALVVYGFILLCRAYVEVAFIDDFSYVHTAWNFAQTGHFRYFGWSAVPLGVQTVWAYPFIKLFGATYLACRLANQSMLLLSVVVYHSILRHAGLNRAYAALGALVLGLSPIMLILASSFMSDICALFLMLLGVWCAIRMLRAETKGKALLWLVAGFATSMVGVSERQTLVLTGAVLLPCAVWIARQRKVLLVPTAVLWVANLGVTAWVVRWFARQPLSQNATALNGHVTKAAIGYMLHSSMLGLLCLLGLLVPLAGQGLAGVRKLSARAWLAMVVVFVVATTVLVRFNVHYAPAGMFPFLKGTSDWLYNTGRVSGPKERYLATVLIVALSTFFCVVLWNNRKRTVEGRPEGADALSWREVVVLVGPLLLAYTGLVLMRSMWSQLFDRYTLPAVAFGMVFLLLAAQRHIARRVTGVSWGLLLVVALVGVTCTHNWAAEERARETAKARAVGAGVPLTDVMAGFELDGDTELRLRGQVTNPGVVPGGYSGPEWPWRGKAGCDFYHPYTEDIHARYVLVPDAIGCEQPSALGAVDYTAWLPPFHRHIVITEVRREQ